jgi:hypothetical protein
VLGALNVQGRSTCFPVLDDVPELELIGLQRGPAALHLPPDSPVFHEADWWNTSVAKTARTIRGLDLVITTDTMVAHLAGALSTPAWPLLHGNADWRWMVDRGDSPRYPSMRLYRQREPGDWGEVLDRVRKHLVDEQKKVCQDKARGCGDAAGAQPKQDFGIGHTW